MGTGKRRSNGQLARDRRRIADLYLQGWLQADIAKEIERSPATVSRDIKALQGDWLASALIDFNEAKAQELAKIDRLEREYWQAWERSCEDAETVTEKARASKGSERPDSVEKTKQAKGQAGDPRFLSGIQWCIEQRCKILGVEAPRKTEISGLLKSLDLSSLTDLQLDRLAKGEDVISVLTSPGSG